MAHMIYPGSAVPAFTCQMTHLEFSRTTMEDESATRLASDILQLHPWGQISYLSKEKGEARWEFEDRRNRFS